MCYPGILKLPYEVTSDTQIQIQLLHFLGQVNESDNSGNEVLEISSCLYPAYCISSLYNSKNNIILLSSLPLFAAVPFDRIDCLESALSLLEDVNHNFNVQQEDYNRVKTLLKELVSVHFNLQFIGIYICSLFGH